MTRNTRQQGHDRYKGKIDELFIYFSENFEPQDQSIGAKYLAVLVSGYLEQAIKEILFQYTATVNQTQVIRYIEKSWPRSRNMRVDVIRDILKQFDESWSEDFSDWISEVDGRKHNINSIIRWRNDIAHGQEANTTGVTLNSVRIAFSTITELVRFIEQRVNA